MVSLARPSTGCPAGAPGAGDDPQPGKLMLSWSVVSGRVSVATPPRPIVAWRVPNGLLTRILDGAAAEANAGCTTIRETGRTPCQPSEMTGFGAPAIHGVRPGRSRLSGPNTGSDPQVELAV